MRYPSYFILALSLCALLPVASLATTSNVSGPNVHAGEAEIELRVGSDYDDEEPDRYRQRLSFEYGFSDSLAMKLISRQAQREGEHLEYAATDIETKWQWFEDEQDGFDGAFKLVYGMADGDDGADSLDLYWLYQITRHDFTYRHNSVIGTEFGEDAEHTPNLELRWQVLANIWEHHSLGLEMFNHLGVIDEWAGFDAQGHRMGPVVSGKLSERLSYQTGVQFGLSDDAPDIGIKFFIGTSF